MCAIKRTCLNHLAISDFSQTCSCYPPMPRHKLTSAPVATSSSMGTRMISTIQILVLLLGVVAIGFCAMPSTITGAGLPVTSRIVGTMSITWWNYQRRPPLSLMCPGQEIAIP